MANALQLHPASVMIGALVGLNLFGVIGMILAAPTLATLKLGFDYATVKMMDHDPWESIKSRPSEIEHRNEKRGRLAKNTRAILSKFFNKKQSGNNEYKQNPKKPINPRKGD
jgi:hypothetical protein